MDELIPTIRAALERVGDRWTLPIVAALIDAPRRFGDLESAVAGIAPNVLSQRLKSMEADGLLVATPYQQRPMRLSYELTARGRELADVLRLLAAWWDDGIPEHDACGTALEVTWWCPTCEVEAASPEHALHRV